MGKSEFEQALQKAFKEGFNAAAPTMTKAARSVIVSTAEGAAKIGWHAAIRRVLSEVAQTSSDAQARGYSAEQQVMPVTFFVKMLMWVDERVDEALAGLHDASAKAFESLDDLRKGEQEQAATEEPLVKP